MKYLITGGSGFIGSNIARFLLEQGDQVRILDNLATGRKENLEDIRDRIEYVDGDIRDFWTVTEAVKGVDYVLHQAALASVPRSVDNPQTSNAVNIDGTLNMLEASRRAGVKKFVMASSSSIYGESEELPKHEGMVPSPLSPYAVNKLTDEHYCKVYWNLYQMPTACLRYFNIFGPYQDPTSQYSAVIPLFITALKNGRKPVIFGDGEQSRDFTFVENAVRANILAATNEKMVGDNFNVACGAQFTLNDLVRKLGEILGVKGDAEYADPRPGDIMHSYATIDKIRSFGYEPTVDFDEGLKRTVGYYD
ncbi:MAG: SDR family oxidoreductase [bacterium]|nr:SDR family oxidoreductase [bacterium]